MSSIQAKFDKPRPQIFQATRYRHFLGRRAGNDEAFRAMLRDIGVPARNAVSR